MSLKVQNLKSLSTPVSLICCLLSSCHINQPSLKPSATVQNILCCSKRLSAQPLCCTSMQLLCLSSHSYCCRPHQLLQTHEAHSDTGFSCAKSKVVKHHKLNKQKGRWFDSVRSKFLSFESNTHPPYFPKIYFNIIPIYALVVQVISFLLASQPEFRTHFSSPPVTPHGRPSHSSSDNSKVLSEQYKLRSSTRSRFLSLHQSWVEIVS